MKKHKKLPSLKDVDIYGRDWQCGGPLKFFRELPFFQLKPGDIIDPMFFVHQKQKKTKLNAHNKS